RDRARDPTHERKLELRDDRDEDVQAGHAAGLRVARQAEVVHHALSGHGDLAHVCPGVDLRRVQIAEAVARLVHLGYTRVPVVRLDASQVRYPGKTGRIGDDRQIRLVPGWIVDVHGLQPP